MKLFGLIWGILILQESTLAAIQDGFAFKTAMCDGKNGGLLPMFGNCKGYYVCADGRAVIGTCDENTLFNPLTLHCDKADEVDCIFDAQGALTSDNESSSESDEDDDEVIVKTDPPVTVKPVKKQTSAKQDVEVSDVLSRMCAGKKDGVMLAKKGSCEEYFVCKAKKPHLRQCSGQQHFSPSRRICMKPSEAKCSAAKESVQLDGPATTGGMCSEEKENSLVAHRSDCGKFMLCSNMMFLVMDCPSGLHFNAASSRCDYPRIAKCQTQQKKSKKLVRKPKRL